MGEQAERLTRPLSRRRRRRRSSATPRLWRGLRAWLRDGRLVGALLALSSAVALGYLFFSPLFQVHEIEVMGNLVLPADEAIRYSRVEGSNLFLLDVAAVIERLHRVPYVEEVRVNRELPNRVQLRIEERFPRVSWWPVNGSTRYLVSDEGLVLGPEQPEMSELIYIVGLDGGGPFRPGDRVDAEAVRTAQRLFSRLCEDMRIPLQPFEYSPERGITAVGMEGWRAHFGDGSFLERKVQNLLALLQSGISFAEADLRIPDQVRYR